MFKKQHVTLAEVASFLQLRLPYYSTPDTLVHLLSLFWCLCGSWNTVGPVDLLAVNFISIQLSQGKARDGANVLA